MIAERLRGLFAVVQVKEACLHPEFMFEGICDGSEERLEHMLSFACKFALLRKFQEVNWSRNAPVGAPNLLPNT